MHYNDVMLCYGISPDELKQAYIAKFEKKYDTLVNSRVHRSFGTTLEWQDRYKSEIIGAENDKGNIF